MARPPFRLRAPAAQSVCAALLSALAACPADAAPPELLAERIDAANAARLVLGGTDAVGGIDDWALRNGTLCAVVSDPSHQNNLSITGGALIDLGYCGRADDQFLLLQPLLNNSLSSPVPVESVRAEVEGDAARLISSGTRDGIGVETRYELDLARPARLRIETRVERAGPGLRLYGLAGALANVRSLTPFSLSIRDPAEARGFVHPAYAGRGLGAIGEAASPVDAVVAVGAAPLEPGVAYGQRFVGARLERASGESVEVPHFFLVDGLATVLATFVRPFWLGDGRSLGLLQLLQTRLMNLSTGDRLALVQEIWVGERADVASVTDLLFADAPLLVGRADDPSAVVHVDGAGGGPVTQARVADDGRFALRLPVGDYVLRARADGGREIERPFRQTAQGTELGVLAVGAPGRLRLPRGAPMRLVFLGRNGTPDPDFDDDLRGFVVTREEGGWTMPSRNDLHLTGLAMDPERVTLRPGSYRVFATLGPEFSLTEAQVDIRAGETVELDIHAPTREVETPGWISSDFHVHAGHSLDTPLRPDVRAASFVAQGGEVLIITEHDAIYDYAPLIRELGLRDRLASIVGLEITSEVPTELTPHTNGHANAFPMPLRPHAYLRGAVPDEGRRWREVIAELRALPGERVIQLNHPRFDEPGIERRAFLSHMGPAAAPYDPTLPLGEPPNRVLIEPDPVTGVRDLDFDAIELLNGWHMKSYLRSREDWFSFLRQGERLTGTANSDSHFLRSVVASPRSYVQAAPDDVRSLDADAFVRSVRGGRVYGTTGPLLELRLGEAGIGETFRGGEGVLRVRVRVASWVPVSELRVFVNGAQVSARKIVPGEPIEMPLRFERDAFVTVEVEGEPSEAYRAVLPSFVPFAFTNPIYVDSDADGRWRPPGPSPAS
jgi:hypothetical protein